MNRRGGTASTYDALDETFGFDDATRFTHKDGVVYDYWAVGSGMPAHAPKTVDGVALAYDAAGNQTIGLGGRTIAYDAANRPETVTHNGVTTTYVYGPDGERLKKVSGGATTFYLGDTEITPA